MKTFQDMCNTIFDFFKSEEDIKKEAWNRELFFNFSAPSGERIPVACVDDWNILRPTENDRKEAIEEWQATRMAARAKDQRYATVQMIAADIIKKHLRGPLRESAIQVAALRQATLEIPCKREPEGHIPPEIQADINRETNKVVKEIEQAIRMRVLVCADQDAQLEYDFLFSQEPILDEEGQGAIAKRQS